MNWPTYPYEGTVETQSFAATGPRDNIRDFTYHAAADVWRHGEHLWRSYSEAQAATCADWTDHYLPDLLAPVHDDGLWAVKGIADIARFPIPTHFALQPVGSIQRVRNLVCTLLAIGNLPSPPPDFDKVVNLNALSQKMMRSPHDHIAYSVEIEGVAVRLMVTRTEGKLKLPDSDQAMKWWRAKLEKRETRAGTIQRELPENATAFQVRSDAPMQSVVREAKAALNISGWQAQKLPESNVWHLARAPYRMILEAIDTSEG